MAKKEKQSDKKWGRVPATTFRSEEELKSEVKKRGEYEEKLAVDISFEDLIKLSVTDIDKPKSR